MRIITSATFRGFLMDMFCNLLPHWGRGKAVKLKTQPDMETVVPGTCWDISSRSPPPSQLGMAGEREKTPLRSNRFNCTQIPLPLHKCHILFWSGGTAGTRPEHSAQSVRPIRAAGADRGEWRDRATTAQLKILKPNQSWTQGADGAHWLTIFKYQL